MRDTERTPQPHLNTTPRAASTGIAPNMALSLPASHDAPASPGAPGTMLTTDSSSKTRNEDGHHEIRHEVERHEVELTVLLFASLKDAAQAGSIGVRVSVRPGAAPTVADLLAQCGQQYPQLAPWLPHVRVAVNCEYADSRQRLASGDEIALLPPVSGGAGRRAMLV